MAARTPPTSRMRGIGGVEVGPAPPWLSRQPQAAYVSMSPRVPQSRAWLLASPRTSKPAAQHSGGLRRGRQHVGAGRCPLHDDRLQVAQGEVSLGQPGHAREGPAPSGIAQHRRRLTSITSPTIRAATTGSPSATGTPSPGTARHQHRVAFCPGRDGQEGEEEEEMRRR